MKYKAFFLFSFLLNSICFGQKNLTAKHLDLSALSGIDTITMHKPEREPLTYLVTDDHFIYVSAKPFMQFHDSLNNANESKFLYCGLRPVADCFMADAVSEGEVRFTILLDERYADFCECPEKQPHQILLNEILNGQFYVERKFDFKEVGDIVVIKKTGKRKSTIYFKTLTGETIFKITTESCK